MIRTRTIAISSILAVVFAGQACVHTEENSPGFEYMPDMYRGPAIEAYEDYGEIRDTIREELNNTISARKPVEGTIPYSNNMVNDMPYPYPDTNEGYEKAGKELTSPLEPTAEVIARGEAIYNDFCIHCHGEEGKGDGPVIVNGGHPAPQAYDGPLKDLPEGKMFHTLTYGKGVMGSHASQLSKTERWEVVAYVRVLQGTLEEPGNAEQSAAQSDTTSTDAGAEASAMEAGETGDMQTQSADTTANQ